MIHALCPHCGRLVYAHDTWAGTTILCPGCKGQVPVGKNERSSSDEPVKLACPRCRAPLRVPPQLAGQRIYCTACGVALCVTIALKRLDSPRTAGRHPEGAPLGEASTTLRRSQEETIHAMCPCGANLHTLREYAGRSAKCPNCGSTVVFPAFDWDNPPAPVEHGTVNQTGPSPRPATAANRSEARPGPTPVRPATGQPPGRVESTVALRDRQVDAALHYMISHAGSPPAAQPGTPPTPAIPVIRTPPSRRRPRRRPQRPPPWFWPLMVASAATCGMVVAILAITFAP